MTFKTYHGALKSHCYDLTNPVRVGGQHGHGLLVVRNFSQMNRELHPLSPQVVYLVQNLSEVGESRISGDINTHQNVAIPGLTLEMSDQAAMEKSQVNS